MIKNYLLFLILVIFINPSYSQVSSKFFKGGRELPKTRKINKEIIISADTLSVLRAQDEEDSKKGRPFRFGKAIPVDINLIENSEKEVHGDTVTFTYSIKAAGAFSINLIFDKLELSSTSSMYIYNKDGTFIYGPVKKNNVPESSTFWTDIVPGNQILIEVREWGKKDNYIHIDKVIFGYKNIFSSNSLGSSLDCNIDINCPEGENWKFEGMSVAMLLMDYATRLCSGTLMNNTAQDLKGYLLTAFHCIDLDENGVLNANEKAAVNNFMFRFNYEATTCGGGVIGDYSTYNGADFRSAYAATDFALLELYNSPKVTDCVTYAGWSRSSSNPQKGTGIHHPDGDVKKISFDIDELSTNNSTINWNAGPSSPAGTHWVVDFDEGTTEGGSSGSAIFNEDHKVVGQLHGGSGGCAPVTKFYGKLNESWLGGGTVTSSLKSWLDPLNSSVMAIDSQIATNISGPDNFCSSANYSLLNLPPGLNVSWTASGSITIPPSSSGYSINVSANGSGSGTLTATIDNVCNGEDLIVSKRLKVGPSITAEGYYYNSSPTYPILPYNSVPNNQVNEVPAYVTAEFSFKGATSSNVQMIDQSDNTITWSTSSGPNNLTLNFDFYGIVDPNQYPPSQWVVWRITAQSSCGSEIFDAAFYYEDSGSYMVYPNPADEEMVIAFFERDRVKTNVNESLPSLTEIKILNSSGKPVFSGEFEIEGNKIKINTKEIPTGIYLLQITRNEKQNTKKIIINH